MIDSFLKKQVSGGGGVHVVHLKWDLYTQGEDRCSFRILIPAAQKRKVIFGYRPEGKVKNPAKQRLFDKGKERARRDLSNFDRKAYAVGQLGSDLENGPSARSRFIKRFNER